MSWQLDLVRAREPGPPVRWMRGALVGKEAFQSHGRMSRVRVGVIAKVTWYHDRVRILSWTLQGFELCSTSAGVL